MKFAFEIAKEVSNGNATAEFVTKKALEKAKRVQESLNAFITIADDYALRRAKEIDAKYQKGEQLGVLAGVPIVIKDNICTKGILTTAGSKSLKDFVPPYSATVVRRLEQADAIIIAKSNLDEFGMGSSNEYSAFGVARNPWDLSRVPGGSSGGSAIAVSTQVAPIALGTDTGGSVRQPASLNGIIGFKPTYGRLSRYGVIAFASSLDQIGIMTQSAQDLTLAMDVMSGHDPYDATSIVEYNPPSFVEAVSSAKDLSGLRVGIVRELCGESNSDEVLTILENTKAILENLGAKIGEVSIPHASYGIATYYLVAPAEASSNLARYDGMVYSTRVGENSLGQAQSMSKSRGASFGAEVRRRVLIGTYALSAGYYDAYYGKALKVRRLIANDFNKAFAEFDILLTPTTPYSTNLIGEQINDPLAMYLNDINTVLANLAGIAGISIPMGMTTNKMPCGMQMLAPAMKDERLFHVTRVIENSLGGQITKEIPDLAE